MNKKVTHQWFYLIIALLLYSSSSFATIILKMASPLNGATISGSQTIKVSVSSTSTVNEVVFYRDNWIAIKSVKIAPYEFLLNTTSLSNGKHQLFAAAYTVAGAGASDIIQVTINNVAVQPSPSPSPTVSPSPSPSPVVSYPQAFKMADFILSLQDAGGAIKDGPGGTICNEDSNMEYALLGLAAAYVKSKDARYLAGFEKGIAWLAAREDMSATKWRGSWYYTYACSAPYDHIATSPGSGVNDVRGVDTTSAYFAYLLYIHRQITKSDVLVNKYAENAKAALDFVLQNNWDPQGATYSSWQLINGSWVLWEYEYTADQADVYLGMRAGALLYDDIDRHFGVLADQLQNNIPALFYDARKLRYAEGRDGGALDWTNESDAIFPVGYVPWVLGNSTQSMASYQWLASKVQANGAIVAYSGDPMFSINVAILGMSANSVGAAEPMASYNWLLTNAYNANTGAVRDTAAKGSDQYSNVAAFTILALLRQSAWNWQ